MFLGTRKTALPLATARTWYIASNKALHYWTRITVWMRGPLYEKPLREVCCDGGVWGKTSLRSAVSAVSIHIVDVLQDEHTRKE